MNKLCTKLGFSIEQETKPGIFKPTIQEKTYRVDVKTMIRRWSQNDSPNGEIQINHEFSVISDYFMNENLSNLVYIVWHGTKWKISSIREEYPRIILGVGGIYNNG